MMFLFVTDEGLVFYAAWSLLSEDRTSQAFLIPCIFLSFQVFVAPVVEESILRSILGNICAEYRCL